MRPVWLHDFAMLLPDGPEIELGAVRDLFHEAYRRVWANEVEDEGIENLFADFGRGHSVGS